MRAIYFSITDKLRTNTVLELVQRQPRTKKTRFAEVSQETRAPREALEEGKGVVGRALPGADGVVSYTRPKNDGAVKPQRIARDAIRGK